MRLHNLLVAAVVAAASLACWSCTTQSGGSTERPSAATPMEQQTFKGVVGETYKTSKPDFPQPVAPPKGAPNVLLILIDDLGFSGTEPYGGIIPTPNIDKLAQSGLIYNRFHNTALCSPSRAALLSGRNHHQMGMGSITELATGYPGYDSVWGKDCASIAEVLASNGYSTSMIGKWHDTPDWETSPVGPFDRWPTGKGFNYFYGFQGGETNQYYPQLYLGTNPVEPTKSVEDGYILTPDLTTHAIDWLSEQQSVSPDHPWFMYYAPGATHAPHHVPKSYIDRFKGKFDMGWDKYREIAFENQKKLGVIPANTILTPRPAELPAWDSLSADEKRLFARQMEVFAGFLAQTDEEVGRLVDAVRSAPNGDNTLIICALGDNGCSAEGGLTGTVNNMATQNGFPDDVQSMLKVIDELGGPKHENHFSVGWAWAVDAPFQWTKQVASHFGGMRTGLIISWPEKIKAHGELRQQFSHMIDIAPTIYDAIGVKLPNTFNGVKQTPLAGVSMFDTFTDANAPEHHTRQYFEIMGNRAIYDNGWIASARHGLPWVLVGRKGDFENDQWELYNLNDDFSQGNDLAASNPEKLKQMQAIFAEEAKKYDVYPLDDRFSERANVPDRPSVTRGRMHFVYHSGTTRIPEGSAPNVKAKSHTITADLVIPEKGAQGVIVAAGGSGGYTLFVKDGKLMYENNFFGRERDLITSSKPLPAGKVTVKFQYVHESQDYGGGGTGTLFINGEEVGQMKFAHVPPVRYGATETFDIGMDLGETVSEEYHGASPFSGTIDQVVIDVEPSNLSAAAQQKTDELARQSGLTRE